MASTDSSANGGGLKITLVKSAIGYNQRQKDTVRALGLRKLHQTVVRPNNPQMRGMVFAVQHLVRVEEVDEAPAKTNRRPGAARSKAAAREAAPLPMTGAAAQAEPTTTTEGRAE